MQKLMLKTGLFVFLFLLNLQLALVATHAALHPVHVVYWKSVLPTTPMPKAITGIIYPSKYIVTAFQTHPVLTYVYIYQ